MLGSHNASEAHAIVVTQRIAEDIGIARHATYGIGCVGASWGYGGDQELRDAGAIAVVDAPDQGFRALARLCEAGHAGLTADG